MKKIYKYLSPERVDVIESLQIRYTQVNALNDPFEAYPGVDQPESREHYWNKFVNEAKTRLPFFESLSPAKQKQYLRALKKDFPAYYKYETDPDRLEELVNEIQKMAGMVQGVLSLSATCTNVLMWSHYCDSHRGFVIEFDRSHPYFGRYIHQVKYSVERPKFDPNLSRHDGVLFQTKSKDWEYEQEWRRYEAFVKSIPLKNGNSFLPYTNADSLKGLNTEIRLFPFPKEALTCVILGWKSSDELEKRVQQALEKNCMSWVKIIKAVPDRADFKMNVINHT
jgi:Protein of unknown function (DUF2971)